MPLRVVAIQGATWEVFDVRLPDPAKWVVLDETLAAGWLCFESGDGDRRRLTPIPESWDRLPDSGLQLLWSEAVAVGRRRSA